MNLNTKQDNITLVLAWIWDELWSAGLDGDNARNSLFGGITNHSKDFVV
jgi:hypothetical protein